MKLELADLYYIPNFRFANGSTRDKYLLVLNHNNDNTIVLSLPTSKGRVPTHLEKGQFGCINCDASLFNCYRFLNGVDITEDIPSFSFPLDTFLYGEWIQDWSSDTLKMDYSIEDVDYFFRGKLKRELLKDTLICFINSVKVKRKYKAIFKELLNIL